MHKIFKQSAVVLSLAASSFAGGLMHNTNQAVDYIRNFAQDATTGVHGVFYNPAGLAFGTEGFHIALHSQTIWQTRTVTAEGLGEYEGKAFVPMMPSFYADWHHGNWNVFGGFMIVGGGGSAEFDDGLPMIDGMLSQILGASLSQNDQLSALMQGAGLSAMDLYGASFEGTQYIFGFTLGGAYKINDMFSVALAARFNYATNTYKGGMNSTEALEGVVEQTPLEDEVKAGIKKQLSATLNQKLLNVDQSGWGITPIASVHFHYKKLDAAIKYEHNTSIEVENDTKEIADAVAKALPQFLDGKKNDNDMPGILAVGVNYAWMPWLRTAAGYHLYFDTSADYAGDKEDKLDHNEHEIVFGVEVDPLKWLTVSAGVQKTFYGLTDEYIEDLSFNLDSWTFGGGFAFKLTPWMKLQLGYMITIYDEWNKVDALTKLPTEYDRTSHDIAIGFNFDF